VFATPESLGSHWGSQRTRVGDSTTKKPMPSISLCLISANVPLRAGGKPMQALSRDFGNGTTARSILLHTGRCPSGPLSIDIQVYRNFAILLHSHWWRSASCCSSQHPSLTYLVVVFSSEALLLLSMDWFAHIVYRKKENWNYLTNHRRICRFRSWGPVIGR